MYILISYFRFSFCDLCFASCLFDLLLEWTFRFFLLEKLMVVMKVCHLQGPCCFERNVHAKGYSKESTVTLFGTYTVRQVD